MCVGRDTEGVDNGGRNIKWDQAKCIDMSS